MDRTIPSSSQRNFKMMVGKRKLGRWVYSRMWAKSGNLRSRIDINQERDSIPRLPTVPYSKTVPSWTIFLSLIKRAAYLTPLKTFNSALQIATVHAGGILPHSHSVSDKRILIAVKAISCISTLNCCLIPTVAS